MYVCIRKPICTRPAVCVLHTFYFFFQIKPITDAHNNIVQTYNVNPKSICHTGLILLLLSQKERNYVLRAS
jgi:hypothetical protein